jgi:hypothetical protein
MAIAGHVSKEMQEHHSQMKAQRTAIEVLDKTSLLL